MQFIDTAIDDYLDGFADSGDPLLHEMEALAEERRFPIVGPQVGRMLFLLTRAIEGRQVLELGSGFGYSAWWFAKAVGAGGQVVLTEGSPERAAEAVTFLTRAGLRERVRVEIGDALELIERVGGEFDVVFNDVDKHDYPRVLDKVPSVLRPGGLFITDNMLWLGQVLPGADGHDEASTQGVLELTRRLRDSPRFDTMLLPVRDGVSVSILRP